MMIGRQILWRETPRAVKNGAEASAILISSPALLFRRRFGLVHTRPQRLNKRAEERLQVYDFVIGTNVALDQQSVRIGALLIPPGTCDCWEQNSKKAPPEASGLSLGLQEVRFQKEQNPAV